MREAEGVIVEPADELVGAVWLAEREQRMLGVLGVRLLADDGAKLGPAGTVRAAVMRPTPLSSSAGQDRA